MIALTGSDFGAGLPLWAPLEVKARYVLRYGGTKAGARAYLAVRGGIDAPLTLGAPRRTCLRAWAGRHCEKARRCASVTGPSASRAGRPNVRPNGNAPQPFASQTDRKRIGSMTRSTRDLTQ